jgi:hypothetical protein
LVCVTTSSAVTNKTTERALGRSEDENRQCNGQKAAKLFYNNCGLLTMN